MRGPLYHLGHGLSYTTFEYDKASVSPAEATADEEITISCEVTNSGEMDGDSVVQLYLKDEVGSVAPYSKFLRGFERVNLKAGETKTATFTINPKRDLKMLDRANNWIVESRKYTVMIGESSSDEDVKQTAEFTIK